MISVRLNQSAASTSLENVMYLYGVCVCGQQAAESKEHNGYDDLFDEDDGGGLLDECRSVSAAEDDDDDDDLMPATRKPRHRGNLLDDDENSRGAAHLFDLSSCYQ